MYLYSDVSGVRTINVRYDDGINLIYCFHYLFGLLTIVVELVSDKLVKVFPVMVVTPTMFGAAIFYNVEFLSIFIYNPKV